VDPETAVADVHAEASDSPVVALVFPAAVAAIRVAVAIPAEVIREAAVIQAEAEVIPVAVAVAAPVAETTDP
jgi:hypothetical protein